jgi:hypothetical protein
MPTPFQYPLERCPGSEERWLRLLEKAPLPDQDDDDDDEEEDEAEEDRERAVIREPDKDE